MRNGFVALIMLMSTAGMASAQGLAVAPPKPEVRVTPDEVVARLMSFDRNRDGKVALGELSERMEPVVARGDRGGDGALDAAEIRALAAMTAAGAADAEFQGRGGGPAGPFVNFVSARYAFGDTVGQTSRMRIQDTIEDLRLAAPETTLQAKRIGAAFADEMDAAASARLREALPPLFTADELTRFDADLTGITNARVLVARTSDGSETRTFVVTGDPTTVLSRQLQPDQFKVADSAVARFDADRQLDDARRAALVAEMSSVMTAEECDDFGAALARRPLVKGRSQVLGAAGMLEVLMVRAQSLQSPLVANVVVAVPSR